jgi:hypothetical protein
MRAPSAPRHQRVCKPTLRWGIAAGPLIVCCVRRQHWSSALVHKAASSLRRNRSMGPRLRLNCDSRCVDSPRISEKRGPLDAEAGARDGIHQQAACAAPCAASSQPHRRRRPVARGCSPSTAAATHQARERRLITCALHLEALPRSVELLAGPSINMQSSCAQRQQRCQQHRRAQRRRGRHANAAWPPWRVTRASGGLSGDGRRPAASCQQRRWCGHFCQWPGRSGGFSGAGPRVRVCGRRSGDAAPVQPSERSGACRASA